MYNRLLCLDMLMVDDYFSGRSRVCLLSAVFPSESKPKPRLTARELFDSITAESSGEGRREVTSAEWRERHCLLGSGKGRERLQRQTRASLAVLGEDNRPNTAQGQPFTTWRAKDHEHAKQDRNYLLFSSHNAPGNGRKCVQPNYFPAASSSLV